ncbi:MAG: hypothetical protein KTR29_23445 [Rhodothermaceae bacterium]|nr:hypothetical protein [Rhodothermaceae bacterium]
MRISRSMVAQATGVAGVVARNGIHGKEGVERIAWLRFVGDGRIARPAKVAVPGGSGRSGQTRAARSGDAIR